MGWSVCVGEDGREIGYAVDATCDHPECSQEIHRGLAYCCGGMHCGEELETADGFYTTCGRYFCEDHRTYVVDARDLCFSVCEACEKEFRKVYLPEK